MQKTKQFKTTTYQLNDTFYLDVVEDPEIFHAYLFKKGFERIQVLARRKKEMDLVTFLDQTMQMLEYYHWFEEYDINRDNIESFFLWIWDRIRRKYED